MAKALYTDYTTVQSAVLQLYRATMGTNYSWRYAPSGVGSIMTAASINELETAVTTAAARVVTVGCSGYHTANYSSANSGYRSDRSYDSYNGFSSSNSYNGGDRYY